ncbi:MAG: insulinase family protein [Ignavibacteria bacterium]|nr:insulinase family protein [Ignavibacteria bacterium]
MKKLISLAIGCVFIFASLVSAKPMKNDRIVELHIPKDATVSFRIMLNAGSQFDPAGKEGLAYLTSRLISEGSTTTDSYEQILAKLFPLAAGFEVSAGKEIASFTGRVHKDNLKEYVELFTRQILAPAFKDEELQRVKQDALNYLQNELKYASDEELGKAVLYGSVFAKTAYAHNDIGTISGLNSITIEDVKAFYKKYYNRNNFILGIGGGYDKKLVDKIWNELQKLPEGKVADAPKIEPAPINGQQLVLVEKNANATAVSIGYPIDLHRGNKEWYALAIANSWLGEHRNSSSHLYQVIREARGMNYGDYSYIEHYPFGGVFHLPPVNVPRKHHIFEIWLRPMPNEDAQFALRAALRELHSLIDKGMTPQQFDLTRKFLKNYVLQYAPTTSKRLGYALDDKFYGMNTSHLQLYRKMMDEVTLDDVNKAIKKYFQDKNMVITLITKNAKDLAERIINNAESPKKYSTPKPASVLEEDKDIAKYPLQVKKENVTIIPVEDLFK